MGRGRCPEVILGNSEGVLRLWREVKGLESLGVRIPKVPSKPKLLSRPLGRTARQHPSETSRAEARFLAQRHDAAPGSPCAQHCLAAQSQGSRGDLHRVPGCAWGAATAAQAHALSQLAHTSAHSLIKMPPCSSTSARAKPWAFTPANKLHARVASTG